MHYSLHIYIIIFLKRKVQFFYFDEIQRLGLNYFGCYGCTWVFDYGRLAGRGFLTEVIILLLLITHAHSLKYLRTKILNPQTICGLIPPNTKTEKITATSTLCFSVLMLKVM